MSTLYELYSKRTKYRTLRENVIGISFNVCDLDATSIANSVRLSSSNVKRFSGALIFIFAGQFPVPILTVRKSSSFISWFQMAVLLLLNTKL